MIPRDRIKTKGRVLMIPKTGNPIFKSEKRIKPKPNKQIPSRLRVNFINDQQLLKYATLRSLIIQRVDSL